MGRVKEPIPVVLIVAAFSRYREALDWSRNVTQARWGKIILESPELSFAQTSFYEAEMGSGLVKQIFAFEKLIDPGTIPDYKLAANALEDQYRQSANWPEKRPLNLDPGYVTEAKLVLATTKDRDHRVYLRDGILAEVTLHHQDGIWKPRPWTYPDYARPDVHAFLSQCRQYLRERLGR